MATTSKVTRFDALSAIIAFAEDNGYENDEILDIARKMRDKLKTPSKAGTITAAAKVNDDILDNNIHLFDDGKVLTAREFANNANGMPVDSNGRPSVHKATAILVRGVNTGKLVKVPAEKKSAPMQYALNN